MPHITVVIVALCVESDARVLRCIVMLLLACYCIVNVFCVFEKHAIAVSYTLYPSTFDNRTLKLEIAVRPTTFTYCTIPIATPEVAPRKNKVFYSILYFSIWQG